MARIKSVAVLFVATMFAGASVFADTFLVDLTHPIPTFQPMEGDPMKPDLSKPWLDSSPIPTFAQQAVFTLAKFPTSDGHFNLGQIILSEHHGTHVDSPAHYVNNPQTLEPGFPAADDRKLTLRLDADDLIGPVVLIDISGRVKAELDKNGGRPSPCLLYTSPSPRDLSTSRMQSSA